MKEILEKAKKAKGISHKEAAVLMECEDPEINRQIRELAMEIKEKFYGHRTGPSQNLPKSNSFLFQIHQKALQGLLAMLHQPGQTLLRQKLKIQKEILKSFS